MIIEVNDKKTDSLTTTEVADLLKGPQRHPGAGEGRRAKAVDKPIAFNIMRDEIPRYSVPDAFWLKPGIAYINIDAVQREHQQGDGRQAEALGENNIKGLVLDLRDNPGGLLNEGVEVAGHFLKKNEVVVAIAAARQPNKNYTARSDSAGQNIRWWWW